MVCQWGTRAKTHSTRAKQIPTAVIIVGTRVSPMPRRLPLSTSTGTYSQYQGARHSSIFTAMPMIRRSSVNRKKKNLPPRINRVPVSTVTPAAMARHSLMLLFTRSMRCAP